MTISFEGFVVLPPLMSWEAKDKDKIYADMAMSSFARTAELAWQKFVGFSALRTEAPTLIRRWHDRGYRVAKVAVTIEEPEK